MTPLQSVLFQGTDSKAGSNIDKGSLFYQLAKTYENSANGSFSIQAYKQFLQYPESIIPGMQNAERK